MRATAKTMTFGSTIQAAVDSAALHFDGFFGKGQWVFQSIETEASVSVSGQLMFWQTNAVAQERAER